MNKIDEKIFEEFFYYGIDNVPELLEGIVYFSIKEFHKIYTLEEQYKLSNTNQLSQIKNIAYKYALQYYRFIELNRNPNKLINYKTENELQEVQRIINKTIENSEKNKFLIKYNIGYYYHREAEDIFSVIYQKDNRLRKFWAVEVAEQLKQLSIQEKEAPVEYYKNWIDVRWRRSLSRENVDNSEVTLIQSVRDQLNNRIRLAYLKKGNYEYEK